MLLAKSMSMSDLGWHMFRIKSVCVHEHYGRAQSVPVLGLGNLVTLLRQAPLTVLNNQNPTEVL